MPAPAGPHGATMVTPTTQTRASTTRASSSGSSGSSVSAAQRAAAANLARIAGANAQSVRDEYTRAVANYNQADAQARQSADVQQKQNSRKSAGERFLQNQRLQMAAAGLMASAGNALNGSQSGSINDMLRTRTDMDSTEVLDTLRGNQDAVRNALYEVLNANVNARNEAASKAEVALRGIESDTAAQLNTINPSLFVAPGTGGANFGSGGFANARTTPSATVPVGGYIRPRIAMRNAQILQGRDR